jgi:hypothetical protein
VDPVVIVGGGSGAFRTQPPKAKTLATAITSSRRPYKIASHRGRRSRAAEGLVTETAGDTKR